MCSGKNLGLESRALAGWSGFHGHCTGIAAVDLYRRGCVSGSVNSPVKSVGTDIAAFIFFCAERAGK